MPDKYDVIVIGAGTMGIAATSYLAQAGLNVLALEQYSIPNDLSSHSGYTRIIRKAYYEHPDYVPLLQRSYDLWSSLESYADIQLYFETGILYMGASTSSVLTGCRQSSELYNIPLHQISHKETYPFSIEKDWDTFMEPDAGFLDVHKAITSFYNVAVGAGATIRTNEKVLSWQNSGDDLLVTTNKDQYRAKKIVFATGAWTNTILGDYILPLNVTRQTLAWVQTPEVQKYSSPHFPCWFIHDQDYGMFYGFPIHDANQTDAPTGIKIALHMPGESADADHVNRYITEHDKSLMQYFIHRYMPQLQHSKIEYKTCLYTNTPDEHFIIDYLPGFEDRVVFAAGFSGHGFKFAPVIGEILTQKILEQNHTLKVDFLGLSRFYQ